MSNCGVSSLKLLLGHIYDLLLTKAFCMFLSLCKVVHAFHKHIQACAELYV